MSSWQGKSYHNMHGPLLETYFMKRRISKTGKLESRKSKEWPVVVYLWAIGLGLIGYLAGEVTLSTRPHPYHWLLLLVGILLGIGVGRFWYRWRGDIKI